MYIVVKARRQGTGNGLPDFRARHEDNNDACIMCLVRDVAKPCSAYERQGLRDRRTGWRLVPACWYDSHGKPSCGRRTKMLDSVEWEMKMAVAKTSGSCVCQRH